MCREFQRGNCSRGETDCRFAHPTDSPMIDTTDNTVTVCMDYIKSRCSREKCKYFHPPAHLQAKIKSNQQQVSQTGVAAQATGAAMVRQSLILLLILKYSNSSFTSTLWEHRLSEPVWPASSKCEHLFAVDFMGLLINVSIIYCIIVSILLYGLKQPHLHNLNCMHISILLAENYVPIKKSPKRKMEAFKNLKCNYIYITVHQRDNGKHVHITAPKTLLFMFKWDHLEQIVLVGKFAV